MAVVANLWHACQRRHSEPSLWAHAPSPQHRVRQSSLLESQRDVGPGCPSPRVPEDISHITRPSAQQPNGSASSFPCLG